MIRLLLIPFFTIFFLLSCNSESDDYFFEKPVFFSSLNDATCPDSSTKSYVGFVPDNTEKYGARLMKIDGCARKMDKNFKDARDDKTGIYIGGVAIASDLFSNGEETIIAVASTGYVVSDHWKDEEKEEKRLKTHRGRVALRKLLKDMSHDASFDRSFLLDFYPEIIKSYAQKGFFVAGSYFGTQYVGFVDAEGGGSYAEIDFPVSDMAVVGESVFLFNGLTGSIYSLNAELEISPLLTLKDFIGGKTSSFPDGRLVFFKDDKLAIYNEKLELLNALQTPANFVISAVTAVHYKEKYEYRKFDADKMKEKTLIYERGEEGDEKSGGDDFDANWETVDAQNGDVVWIASKTGAVLAYDFANSSWMVEKFSDLNSDYANKMAPYLASSYANYPKKSKTNSSNFPFIDKIEAARGLTVSTIYHLTYEGVIEGSSSSNGVFDAETSTLSDESVDFTQLGIEAGSDFVLFNEKKNSPDCSIPADQNIVAAIEGVEARSLILAPDKYFGEITKCFGNPLSYAIFPKGRYAVSKETKFDKSFVGRGDELAADDSGETPSFSDEEISLYIRKRDDDFATEQESSFYLKINPGTPFVGFSSADMIVIAANPSPTSFVGFSPITRRIVEYDVINDKVAKVYK